MFGNRERVPSPVLRARAEAEKKDYIHPGQKYTTNLISPSTPKEKKSFDKRNLNSK